MRLRSILPAFAVMLIAAAPTLAGELDGCRDAQTHPPSAYTCEALALIEKNSVAVGKVDWPAIKADALAAAREAPTIEDAHRAVAAALLRLDPHSRLLSRQRSVELKAPQARFDRVQANAAARIAYVDVRGFVGTDADSMQAYVRTLREGFAAAEDALTCGYIVDLRRNPGGNMWPPLLGLQPLLGTGAVGGFRTRDGSEAYWQLEANRASAAEVVALTARQPFPVVDTAATRPVAVLLGTETASAGEAIAIAFRERPATRSFGWRTAGLATANAGFKLRDDVTLILAVADIIDRDGRAYAPYVKPDEETIAAIRVHRTGRYVDVTRNAATEWLAARDECAAPAH
jgi:C-terminal processing protease CtpA/Prc